MNHTVTWLKTQPQCLPSMKKLENCSHKCHMTGKLSHNAYQAWKNSKTTVTWLKKSATMLTKHKKTRKPQPQISTCSHMTEKLSHNAYQSSKTTATDVTWLKKLENCSHNTVTWLKISATLLTNHEKTRKLQPHISTMQSHDWKNSKMTVPLLNKLSMNVELGDIPFILSGWLGQWCAFDMLYTMGGHLVVSLCGAVGRALDLDGTFQGLGFNPGWGQY